MPIKKNINNDFFKNWTPEMAYVLGFFFADGSYDVNKNGGEYFSFQIVDRDLLEKIKKVMDSDHKISVRKRIKLSESTQYRVQVGSKKMCADLRRVGVTNRKAYTAKFPHVPTGYVEHFIRGYFDGDGNVWSGLIHPHRTKQTMTLMTAFTSCSSSFLEGLQNTLVDLGMGRGSLFKRGGAYRLQYSAKDSIILFDLMYGRPVCRGLFLERKKKVFEKFIESKK